jgi:hypothetical protein
MGNLTAVEISESGLTLEQQLEWHLRGNHYPPIPVEMIEPCVRAIELANAGDWNAEIELPKVGDFQITYKGGHTTAPVWAMVEQHHLSAFLDDEDDFESEDY